MKSDKLFILCIIQNKSLKKYTTTQSNLFNNVRIKDEYYIYELRKQ